MNYLGSFGMCSDRLVSFGRVVEAVSELVEVDSSILVRIHTHHHVLDLLPGGHEKNHLNKSSHTRSPPWWSQEEPFKRSPAAELYKELSVELVIQASVESYTALCS